MRSKPAPEGLIGLAPQTELGEEDMRLMSQGGVRTIRVPLPWSEVESLPPEVRSRSWRALDRTVRLAAREGISVLPFVWGTPGWLASQPRREPVFSRSARRRWAEFLRSAVRRYGPDGGFWDSRPLLPRKPIRDWQIWNEPNIVTFSQDPDPRRYASLVRLSARALRTADPGARVLLAGLFGRPLQVPPNIAPVQYLAQALDGTGLARVADAAAFHPYVARAGAVPSKIEALRRVLRLAGKPRMPLWITEMGWGSDSGETRWERGLQGQARELNTAMRHLVGSRRRWRIQRIYWYSWIDAPVCIFCDSAGLFTEAGRPKPSWYAFNAWTGGDPQLRCGGPGEGSGGELGGDGLPCVVGLQDD